MTTDVQEALRDLEIISLVKDVEKKLTEYYGAQQPECCDGEIHGGYWQVWVTSYGWITVNDLLQGKIL